MSNEDDVVVRGTIYEDIEEMPLEIGETRGSSDSSSAAATSDAAVDESSSSSDWCLVRMSKQFIRPDKTYVFGKVLPRLRQRHKTVHSAENEYTHAEARKSDFTGLPVMANHITEEEYEVGTVVGYTVKPTHASVLLEVRDDTLQSSFAINNALAGSYGSLSLSHKYRSTITMAAPGTKRVRKRALECSLVSEPGRPGADIDELIPSRQCLLSRNTAFLHSFAKRYKHPLPPRGLTSDENDLLSNNAAHKVPQLVAYVNDTLGPSVDARLQRVLVENEFVCNANATTSASGERQSLTPSVEYTVAMSATNNNNGNASSGAKATAAPAAATQPPANAAATTASKKPDGAAANKAATTETAAADASRSVETGVDANAIADPSATPAQLLSAANKRIQEMEAILQKQADEREAAARQEREAAESVETEEKRKVELATDAAARTIFDDVSVPDKAVREAAQEALRVVSKEMLKQGSAHAKRTIGTFAEVLVKCNKKRREEAEENESATQEAAELAASLARTQTYARMSGPTARNNVPPPRRANNNDAASDNSGQEESGIVQNNKASAEMQRKKRVVPVAGESMFGLTPEEYMPRGTAKPANNNNNHAADDDGDEQVPNEAAAAAGADDDGEDERSGRVNASAKSYKGGDDAPAKNEEITPETAEWAGKVFLELVRKDSVTGEFIPPTLAEVARGGYVQTGVVKRNLAGRATSTPVLKERFAKSVPFGLQHLNVKLFDKMSTPLDDRTRATAPLEGKSAVSLAEKLEHEWPALAYQPRVGNDPTDKFRWANPELNKRFGMVNGFAREPLLY